MDYRKAAKDVGAGHLLPLYVCYGQEKYLMQQFIDYVADQLIEPEYKEFAISKFDLKETSIEAVIEDAETPPFMVPHKLIFAHNALFLTGAKDTGKADHDLDKLVEYLKAPAEYSVIIFTVDAEKLDERKTIVKKIKALDALVPFPLLGPEELHTWVVKAATKAGFTFEAGAVEQLIMNIGANLQQLSTEIEKLSLYLQNSGTATIELIDKLVARSSEQSVFMLVEEVAKLRIERAFLLLEELLKHKEEPIKIMMLIARQFRIMLQVKELTKQGYSQSQIASQIGLHPYAVKIAEGQARSFEAGYLTTIIAMLADLDYQMKSGQIDKVLGLELFLMKLAEGQQR
ncbi:DNA polymerase III subunit delta [Paenibacillus albiflavus]|uniref:DNA polymerase III subunit delta n=1 Tax=Paenibacillus albiflavus TaxID=2545760 RepID=A0A4R4EFZ9_9BACL|nr:DNA polymerase III subunit delta [Paenibacillus albiflavus]TCZ77038.1 DNA polymerase III subunit delta [Paenibacillus albiflavus]